MRPLPVLTPHLQVALAAPAAALVRAPALTPRVARRRPRPSSRPACPRAGRGRRRAAARTASARRIASRMAQPASTRSARSRADAGIGDALLVVHRDQRSTTVGRPARRRASSRRPGGGRSAAARDGRRRASSPCRRCRACGCRLEHRAPVLRPRSARDAARRPRRPSPRTARGSTSCAAVALGERHDADRQRHPAADRSGSARPAAAPAGRGRATPARTSRRRCRTG